MISKSFKSKPDRILDSFIYIFLAVFALATLFPIYYVFVVSVTPYSQVLSHGGFVLIPTELTFDAYYTIFASGVVPRALKTTVTITVVGTLLNLLATLLLAYPLSKKDLAGRGKVLMAIVFTMLFSGGMIPLYLVVRATGLLDSIWALIVPGLISTFNLLIMKTYFENLPAEVEDAARVDGCSDAQTLFRIVVPLSKPIFATIGLFYAVGHWNSYFSAILYIQDRALYPIQVVLQRMIQSSNISQELLIQNPQMVQQLPPITIQMATVVVAILPIIMVYPFLQRYFIKGIMIGAIKG